MSFKQLIALLSLLAALSLVACGGRDVPAPTVSTEADSQISEPAPEEEVVEAEPTAVIEVKEEEESATPESTAVPTINATPVFTPTRAVTAVPTDTVELLVKPTMPTFVLEDGPACGTPNEYSQYLGQDSEFSTALYMPFLDGRHDMVVFYVPVDSDYMHYYVWMGEPLEKYPAGSTYLIVRFDRDTCTFEQYQEWAESHLDDAQDWADSFNEWHERSLEPAEETVAAEGTPAAPSEAVQCEFNDGNPNAFILTSQTSRQMNFVVTEPSWGKVTITSTDQQIVVEENTTVVDGCMRLGFTVPNHSGPMNLLVTAENGTVLSNLNFWENHAQLGPDGHSFDAP